MSLLTEKDLRELESRLGRALPRLATPTIGLSQVSEVNEVKAVDVEAIKPDTEVTELELQKDVVTYVSKFIKGYFNHYDINKTLLLDHLAENNPTKYMGFLVELSKQVLTKPMQVNTQINNDFNLSEMLFDIRNKQNVVEQ